MAGKGISTASEIKIVALLARGETYKTIIYELKDIEPGLTMSTIMKVKARKQDNLAEIKDKIIAKEKEDALSIKDQANGLIKGRLQRVSREEALRDKLHQDYLDNNIEAGAYYEALKLIPRTTIPELVVVSKEMHQQSKTDTPEAPVGNKDLDAMRKAIMNGDEFELNRLVFKPNKADAKLDEPTEEPV